MPSPIPLRWALFMDCDALNHFNNMERQYQELPVYRHTTDYINDRFNQRFDPSWTSACARGSHKFFRIVFNCAPFTVSKKHDDD